MKLRSLLFGMMAAVAFTACSDKGEDIPVVEEAKTMLGVKTENLSTRADDAINTLTVYVFNAETGVLEATGDDNSKTTTIVEPFEVTEGRKKVIVLANATSNATTLANFLLDTKLLATEGVENLSMNSRVYNVSITKNVINYLGYAENVAMPTNGINITPTEGDYTNEIKMFRNTAKIVLGGIKLGSKLLDTEEEGEVTEKAYYSNPKLTITGVYILGAQGTTLLAGGEGEWTPALPVAKTFYHATDAAYATYATDKYIKPELSTELPALVGSYTTIMESTDGKQVEVEPGTTFYVYENEADTFSTNTIPHTLLVIAGDIEYDMVVDGQDEPKRITLENRFWSVPVGAVPYTIKESKDYSYIGEFAQGQDRATEIYGDGSKYIGIKRNLQYNVVATINSVGYTTPYGGGDKTMLGVQVRVVPWGEVDFDFEIN